MVGECGGIMVWSGSICGSCRRVLGYVRILWGVQEYVWVCEGSWWGDRSVWGDCGRMWVCGGGMMRAGEPASPVPSHLECSTQFCSLYIYKIVDSSVGVGVWVWRESQMQERTQKRDDVDRSHFS